MEGLARLVSESMARHGFEPRVDHRRLPWSRWFRCESSFSLLLVPAKPGIFALAEEVLSPGELGASGGKRMIAVFHVAEAHDLGIDLAHLFAPSSPVRERIDSGRCFARYAVIEDAAQRSSALAAFQLWLASAAEAASGVADFAPPPNPQHDKAPPGSSGGGEPGTAAAPPALPSGF